MITIVAEGDLLNDSADALVNPVNCVGVMGKGLAAQFKDAHPNAFRAYANACAARTLRPGVLHVSRTQDNNQYIVHFPTKDHWRDSSRLSDIDTGLVDLVKIIGDLGILSIAVPALGTGLGGLKWADVEPVMLKHLEPLNVDVRLYPPRKVRPGENLG